MYALARNQGFNGVLLNTLSVFALGSGLLIGSFFTKGTNDAKKIILAVVSCAFLLSLFIPFISVRNWVYILPLTSFIMGSFIPNIAYPIQAYTTYHERFHFTANLLIGGALVLILARVLTVNVKAEAAYVFIELLLLLGLFLMSKLDLKEKPAMNPKISKSQKVSLREFWIFFVFIFVITINSGIMFSIIYPYFSEFALLASLYTDIPYIISIYLMSRIVKVNKFYFLYLGLLLVAIAFVLFSVMPQTALAFILISTAMLFASGMYDYFWWSTMLENFELVRNPGVFLGAGLSLNIFGVWFGAFLGNRYLSVLPKHFVAITGMLFVVICLMIILPLNLKLSQFLVNNRFLLEIGDGDKKSINYKRVNHLLSNREKEVFELLINGKHDKEICAELYIAHGTVKTHNRNIYKKLNVNSRSELIKKYGIQ